MENGGALECYTIFCVSRQYLVSIYLQLDCLYLKKQIYSETFCYPTPMQNFICQKSSFD